MTRIKKTDLGYNFRKETDFIGFIISSGVSTGIIVKDLGEELEVESLTRTSIIDAEIIKMIEEKFNVKDVKISACKPFEVSDRVYIVGHSTPEDGW